MKYPLEAIYNLSVPKAAGTEPWCTITARGMFSSNAAPRSGDDFFLPGLYEARVKVDPKLGHDSKGELIASTEAIKIDDFVTCTLNQIFLQSEQPGSGTDKEHISHLTIRFFPALRGYGFSKLKIEFRHGVKPVILIVEDDPALLDLASDLLRDKGFIVEGVGSAEEGIKVIKDRPEGFYNLVLTDKNCPERDSGLELIAKVRDLSPSTKLLLMSGNFNDTEADLGESRGVKLLQKAFSPEILYRAIDSVLS